LKIVIGIGVLIAMLAPLIAMASFRRKRTGPGPDKEVKRP
jgi:hypothetical protein